MACQLYTVESTVCYSHSCAVPCVVDNRMHWLAALDRTLRFVDILFFHKRTTTVCIVPFVIFTYALYFICNKCF